MPVVIRGETIDADNPKLDLFTTQGAGGPVVDIEVLEVQIFDILTPASPIQVWPVAGRQALDPTTATGSGGDRIAEGHYTINSTPWDVPVSLNIGNHKICWFFKLTAVSPETEFTEEFLVSDIVGGTDFDPVDVAAFKARFPQFADVDAVLVDQVLLEAQRRVPPTCLGDRYADAHLYLSAHVLTMTGASHGEGVSTVKAGSASISYAVADGINSLKSTGYGKMYADLIQLCGPGARVLC